MQAKVNDEVVADSDDTVEMDGCHYFPTRKVKMKFLRESDFSTFCPMKGRARYWDVVVDGEVCLHGAFSYPTPEPGMEMLKDRIAFWPKARSPLKVA